MAAGLEGLHFVLPGVGSLPGGPGRPDDVEVQPQPGQSGQQGAVAGGVLGVPPPHHHPPLLSPAGKAPGSSLQTPWRHGYILFRKRKLRIFGEFLW